MKFNGWTSAWIIWIIMFFAIELPALLNKRKNDTLSEHLWSWFVIGNSKSKGWRLRRSALLLSLVWIVAHLLTHGFF